MAGIVKSSMVQEQVMAPDYSNLSHPVSARSETGDFGFKIF
jgi:hypothetical protein